MDILHTTGDCQGGGYPLSSLSVLIYLLPIMKSQHPLQASVDRGFQEDNTPEEEKLPPTSEGMDRGATYSEQANAFPSSTSSSPSPLQAFSFDGDGSDSADGNTFVLPADAVEMAPADEIFFHGHLLPLHLLSQFSPLPSPRLSADFSDSFTLPIGEHFPDNDRCTGSTNEKSRNGSSKGNFKGRCGNRIHSETTAIVSPRLVTTPSPIYHLIN